MTYPKEYFQEPKRARSGPEHRPKLKKENEIVALLAKRLGNRGVDVTLPWFTLHFHSRTAQWQCWQSKHIDIPRGMHKAFLVMMAVAVFPLKPRQCYWFLNFLLGKGRPLHFPKSALRAYRDYYKANMNGCRSHASHVAMERDYLPEGVNHFTISPPTDFPDWIQATVGEVVAWEREGYLHVLDAYNWDRRSDDLTWRVSVFPPHWPLKLDAIGYDTDWIPYGIPFITTGVIKLAESGHSSAQIE